MAPDAALIAPTNELVVVGRGGPNRNEASRESGPAPAEPAECAEKNDEKRGPEDESLSHPEARTPDNGEILPVAASSELEYFSVADFPEKNQKGPDEDDEGSSDGENLVGNAWGMTPRVFGAQNADDQRAFSGADLV